MPAQNSARFPRPALWIAVPVFLCLRRRDRGVSNLAVDLAALCWLPSSARLAVGCFAEDRLAGIIASISKIAGGDRYTSLPKLLGDGAIRSFSDTAGKIRAA